MHNCLMGVTYDRILIGRFRTRSNINVLTTTITMIQAYPISHMLCQVVVSLFFIFVLHLLCFYLYITSWCSHATVFLIYIARKQTYQQRLKMSSKRFQYSSCAKSRLLW